MRSSSHSALYVDSSHVAVSDTLFYGNGSSPSYDYAVYVKGISTTISITNSRFEDNIRYPLSVEAGDLPGVLQGNTFSGNGVNRLQIRARDKPTILSDVTLPNDNGLDAYEMWGDVWVGQGVTLTVLPGTIIRSPTYGVGLSVKGYLQALGTPTQPITFTMSVGGHAILLDGPGAQATLRHLSVSFAGASAGGIMVQNGATAALQEVRVTDGGRSGLDVNNGTVTVEDSRFSNNAWYGIGYGIEAYNARLAITNTLVSGNLDDGIRVGGGTHLQAQGLQVLNNGNSTYDAGIYAYGTGTAITVTNSTVLGNAGRGVYVSSSARATVRHSRVHDNSSYQAQGSTPLDARYNWWGTTTPTPTLFYGSVLYDPWVITDTFAAGYFDLAQDSYESNDAFARATPLSGVNTALAGFIDPYGDADVYRLDLLPGSDPSAGSGQAVVAIGDAAETPLALKLRLYDIDETLLDAETGAAGGTITATAPVTPGVYYVGVEAGGTYPSSRQPYWLTLLQVDARADLVAATLGQAGRTYDFGDRALDVPVADTAVVTATAPLSLTAPGGYFLHGRLTNSRGQVLAESRSSFFLSDGDLALTLATDQRAYQPGRPVAVSGQVHNTGSATVGPYTLVLSRNGTTFYTESLTLPPDGVHPYSATTAAPGATGPFTLTAEIADAAVVAVVEAADPELDVVLDAPGVVLPGAAAAELRRANVGKVPMALDMDFHGQAHTAALEPGQLVVLSRTLELTQSTAISVAVSGDVDETMLHPIEVSAAPTLTLSPDDPQHEGDVVIPYRLENPGSVDLVAEVVFGLADPQPFRRRTMDDGRSLWVGNLVRSDLPALQRQGVAWLPPQQVAIRHSQPAIQDSPSAIRHPPSS